MRFTLFIVRGMTTFDPATFVRRFEILILLSDNDTVRCDSKFSEMKGRMKIAEILQRRHYVVVEKMWEEVVGREGDVTYFRSIYRCNSNFTTSKYYKKQNELTGRPSTYTHICIIS